MLSKVIGRHICSCFPEGESVKDPVRWQPMNFIVQNRQEYKVLFGYCIPLDGLNTGIYGQQTTYLRIQPL